MPVPQVIIKAPHINLSTINAPYINLSAYIVRFGQPDKSYIELVRQNDAIIMMYLHA